MKVIEICKGIFAIQNDHGRDAPAYYQHEHEAVTDMNNMPDQVRRAFEGRGNSLDDQLVIQHFEELGTIPYWAARKVIEREMWRPHQVKAVSIADFLEQYYKPERYRGRGEEYADTLLASHQRDFERDGFDIISHHDSVTGKVVAYLGDG